MKKRIISLFVLFISISISVLAQVDIKKSNNVIVFNGKEYYIHIVEKGHTLYSLARVYEIPMEEIVFENPAARNQLSIGQELKIPVTSRDKAVEKSLRSDGDEFFYHVVKRGETLKSIAAIYSMARRNLERSNPNLYDPLKTGQYIKIPLAAKRTASVTKKPVQKQKATQTKKNVPKSVNTNYREHIVKPGDNLYRMALNYKVSIEEIKTANPSLGDALRLGQRIKIPIKKKEDEFIIHQVRRRNKLSRIARNYNVDIKDLKKINPRIKDKVRSGDVVRIPLKTEIDSYNVVIAKDDIPEMIEIIKSNVILNQDSIQCMNYIQNVEDTFNIALMMPLYLEDVDSLSFTEDTNVDELLTERPFRFIQFYYGVMMAVDSLRAMGMNIELSVYDVDENISKTIQVLQDPNLPIQDLIIGPFHPDSFKYASNFAKIFEIPIINPLTNRSRFLKDNPFVFKCQSTTESQYEKVRDLVATYFRDSKIFFVNRTDRNNDFPNYISQIQDLIDTGYYIPNEDAFDLIIEKSLADTTTIHISNEFIATMDAATGITTEIDSLVVEDELLEYISIEGTRILTDSVEFNLYDSTYIKNQIVSFQYAQDSIYGFQNEASIYRENVVFILTDDNVFALDLMTKLNIERDTFSTTVVGLPDWRGYKNMDNEILSNLNTHVLYSAFVDYQDRNTNSFIYTFRKRHLTEPLDYAFKGFDISWYFLNALNMFGKDFINCLPYYEQTYIQSKMDFKRVKEGDGFENRFWTILKYDRYHLDELEVFPPNLPVIEDLQAF